MVRSLGVGSMEEKAFVDPRADTRKQARTQENEEVGGSQIQHIPEECLVNAISLSSPADACRAAAVSSAFRLAADSDAVWERFLPPDYTTILDRAVHAVDFYSKKELFLDLCKEHILLDDGRISFGLHRSNGAKCFMLSVTQLGIAWFGTTLYWRERQDPESRFPTIAELLRVCWFNIIVHLNSNILSHNTHYAAYLVYKLTHNASGLSSPRQRSYVHVGGQLVGSIHRVSLHPCNRASCVDDMTTAAEPHEHEHEEDEDGRCVVRYPRTRLDDDWIELEMCDFRTDEAMAAGVNVRITLKELEELNWKNGLIIEGLELRPRS